jgi:hypothetical protein
MIRGMHPDTGQPYQWIGEANPLDDTPKAAPLVTQEQIDAFLAAVHEIMPLVRAGSGGNGGDAARHVNADGLVDDGRESFLRDCIWIAAHDIDGPLTAQAVAGRGWELFEERAWNGDAKYSFDKQAMVKARLLIRRLNDGRIELGGKTSPAPPTHLDTKSNAAPSIGERDQVHAIYRGYLGIAHAYRAGILVMLTAPSLIVGSPVIGMPSMKQIA